MSPGAASLEAVAARRGRWTALLLLAALAALWLASLALMSASGHGGGAAAAALAAHAGHAGHGGGAAGLGALVSMWLAMMVAMMVPVELPAVTDRLRRASGSGTASDAATFLAGLFATWAGYAGVAALAHWELQRRVLLDAGGVLANPAAGAALLVAIGAFQLTPAKRRCLAACRASAAPLEPGPAAGRGLAAGLRHGLASLGCCALLMLLPLAAGGMGLAPMAAVTALLVVEKLGARGLLLGRAAGAALVAWGVALAVGG